MCACVCVCWVCVCALTYAHVCAGMDVWIYDCARTCYVTIGWLCHHVIGHCDSVCVCVGGWVNVGVGVHGCFSI